MIIQYDMHESKSLKKKQVVDHATLMFIRTYIKYLVNTNTCTDEKQIKN